ncbi:NAD(P)-dependent oxidoreductase [Paenibacillus aceris]|uniref:3-hydroxyisobutyrate dehydrogenase-like beta-hydroxyacid dehydrogenase n=1 Tax=Paenibacillus aceris TaxID=869555 RepID=A0ABS4I5H1_9BACL|nr:NAD(P)-dependent oxidoreductase [Paenibacillus aceris]MBP1966164.1 3-hydroxyisobutyrate dehydrogenase-like beta-hydroxyacid dehydrogenase [Paenibacillus aceris]
MNPLDMRQIAFLGLGAMGLPMARNLVKAGFKLHVTVHRDPGPADELRKLGAEVHDSPAGAIAAAGAIISILPEDRQMQQVLLADEVLAEVREGQLLLEMTSGSPGAMKEVAEAYAAKQAHVLDAPVSGGTIGAEKGTLTVMAGGCDKALEMAQPLLEAMAQTVHRVGAIGAGKAVKAINQMLAAVHMLAASEAIALSERLGVDLDALQKVIGSSSGGSWMFANKAQAIAGRNFLPGFKLNLMKKDIGIALQEGKGQPLPVTSQAFQLYEMAAKENGELDFAAVSRVIRG